MIENRNSSSYIQKGLIAPFAVNIDHIHFHPPGFSDRIKRTALELAVIICNWKIQCKLPPKTKRFCPLVLK